MTSKFNQKIEINDLTLIHDDCLNVLKALPENCIDLILTDPPYFKVKSNSWDNQWKTKDEYLAWLDDIFVEFFRVLKPNGSLYCFYGPKLSAETELLIKQRFNVLNHIVWAKPNGPWLRQHKESLRSYFPASERIIFAEHYNAEGQCKGEVGYAKKCREIRQSVFAPLIEYFKSALDLLGISAADINKATGSQMCSRIRLFHRMIDGKRHYYSISPKFWVPYDTVYGADVEDRKTAERFQKWINTGHLSVTDGAEIDYREILHDAVESNKTHPVEVSPIDPHGATNLSHNLADEGLNPVTIIQNFTNLSDPMKELEAAIESGRFHHDGNPILTWCISNVVGKHLPGNDDIVRPIKERNENKIDGALALIMGIGRIILLDQEDSDSVYDKTDVLC